MVSWKVIVENLDSNTEDCFNSYHQRCLENIKEWDELFKRLRIQNMIPDFSDVINISKLCEDWF